MLQIFTYSTGLALTGRSAACVPATATRPAAEPRRRLFTIFILNLQVALVGGFRLRRVRSTPWKVPFSPLIHSASGTPPQTEQGDLGMPPSVAMSTLTNDFPLATIKRPFEQLRIQFLSKCCLKNTQPETRRGR